MVVEAINEFFVSVSAHLPKVDPIILDDLADMETDQQTLLLIL